MVKVGLKMSSSRRLSPRASPLMKQVLPAPSSPIRPTSSPPSSSEASRRPHDLVWRADALSTTRTISSSSCDSGCESVMALLYYSAGAGCRNRSHRAIDSRLGHRGSRLRLLEAPQPLESLLMRRTLAAVEHQHRDRDRAAGRGHR